MANTLGENITGKYVVIKESRVTPQFRDLKYRVVQAQGGFGCSPDTAGNAVFVEGVFDGEKWRTQGYDIERYASDEEVEQVKALRDVKRCEETVVKDGQPQACDRPLDDRGYCDRPGDHV